MRKHFKLLNSLALCSDALISAGMILMNEHFSFFEELGVQKGKLHYSSFCLISNTCVFFSSVTPIVGLSLLVLVFGYLLSVFRMKYGGYPYRYMCMYICSLIQYAYSPNMYVH